MRTFLILLFLVSFTSFAQPTFQVTTQEQSISIGSYDTVSSSLKLVNMIQDLEDKHQKYILDKVIVDTTCSWIFFDLINKQSNQEVVYLSLAFADHIDAFIIDSTQIRHYYSGDLVPIDKREIKTGARCFIAFPVNAKTKVRCIIRVNSTSNISQQLRPLTLKSGYIYTQMSYNKRFEISRYYQAFFYGAIFIMLFYNLFIYVNTLYRSYLYYVLFLTVLIVFMASNNGYLVELLYPGDPRIDLYIRFVSAPLLLLTFLIFSFQYLKIKEHDFTSFKILRAIILTDILVLFFMLFGYWRIGRNCMIALSL